MLKWAIRGKNCLLWSPADVSDCSESQKSETQSAVLIGGGCFSCSTNPLTFQHWSQDVPALKKDLCHFNLLWTEYIWKNLGSYVLVYNSKIDAHTHKSIFALNFKRLLHVGCWKCNTAVCITSSSPQLKLGLALKKSRTLCSKNTDPSVVWEKSADSFIKRSQKAELFWFLKGVVLTAVGNPAFFCIFFAWNNTEGHNRTKADSPPLYFQLYSLHPC